MTKPTIGQTGWGQVLNDHLDTLVGRVAGLTTDGTGDNSTLLQAAVDAASTAGGGEVRLPPGTIRCNVTLPAKVILVGEGVDKTTLKAVAGSNAAVVQGLNFATLTGKAYAVGDISLGCYQAGLRNLTVDGDKASQTSGWAVRLWGRSLVLTDVQVQNGKDGGLWTEFTTHDAGTNSDLLEGFFDRIKIANCSGDGWRFRGPHDSTVTNFVTVSNTGWGFKSESAASSYTGGVKGVHWNSWLNANSFYFGAAVDLAHCDATGTAGTGIEMAADTGGARFTGMIVSGHPTGVLMRGTDHTFQGVIQNASTTALQIGAAGTSAGRIVAEFVGSTIGKGIDLVNVSGPGIYRTRLTTVTTLINGFGSSADYFDCWSNTESRLGLPGTQFAAIGWTPKYPQSNGVLLTKDASGTTVGAAGAAAALPANPVAYWTVKDESGTSFKVPVYNT